MYDGFVSQSIWMCFVYGASFKYTTCVILIILGQLIAQDILQIVAEQSKVRLVQLVQAARQSVWNVPKVFAKPFGCARRALVRRKAKVVRVGEMQRQRGVVDECLIFAWATNRNSYRIRLILLFAKSLFSLTNHIVLDRTRMAQLVDRLPVLVVRRRRLVVARRRLWAVATQLGRQQVLNEFTERNVVAASQRLGRRVWSKRTDNLFADA